MNRADSKHTCSLKISWRRDNHLRNMADSGVDSLDDIQMQAKLKREQRYLKKETGIAKATLRRKDSVRYCSHR
jgi:hypothetical protein